MRRQSGILISVLAVLTLTMGSAQTFEGECGEFGCAHYQFVRTPAP